MKLHRAAAAEGADVGETEGENVGLADAADVGGTEGDIVGLADCQMLVYMYPP